MAEIGIIGSGNLGANAAFFMAENQIGNVCLYDIREGLSFGKALDLMEAAPVRQYRTSVDGSDELSSVLESKVLVIAAGAIREPGQGSDDLVQSNSSVIKELAVALREYRGVVIIATEPVDPLTALFVTESGLDPRRVFGFSGILDGARMRLKLSRELGLEPEDIDALVIGRHDERMIALPNYTRVSGIPVLQLMEEQRLLELASEVGKSEERILELAQRTNSFYGPAAALAELTEAVIWDSGRVASVSVVLHGEYEMHEGAIGLPAVIGAEGVRRVILPRLTERELEQLRSSVHDVAEMVRGVGGAA